MYVPSFRAQFSWRPKAGICQCVRPDSDCAYAVSFGGVSPRPGDVEYFLQSFQEMCPNVKVVG